MPPYIIFSDRTLIDMCVRAPQNKEELLNVTGVGAAKCEKYGEIFLDTIGEFLARGHDVVLCIPPEEVTGKQPEEPKKQKEAKKKEKKSDFYLTIEAAAGFCYSDMYYLMEIRDELNRLRDEGRTKKIAGTHIFAFLREKGYVTETERDGFSFREVTQKGTDAGIETENRISDKGTEYAVLRYPMNIQKMIVENYIKARE